MSNETSNDNDATGHSSLPTVAGYPKMLPCPFCGGDPRIKRMASQHVAIECPDCRAQTAIYKSESFAWQCWDHRDNIDERNGA